jgi:hypothetical protein
MLSACGFSKARGVCGALYKNRINLQTPTGSAESLIEKFLSCNRIGAGGPGGEGIFSLPFRRRLSQQFYF